ncbi:hypothetical protein B835_908 [Enterococcus mundtii 3F]|nr:hypothetical protein [Enterococcus mundtii 3F]
MLKINGPAKKQTVAGGYFTSFIRYDPAGLYDLEFDRSC